MADKVIGRLLDSAERTAEIFLKREMFKVQKSGEMISPDFVKLHYPCYWHYDILFGLKVVVEDGLIEDPRCRPAFQPKAGITASPMPR